MAFTIGFVVLFLIIEENMLLDFSNMVGKGSRNVPVAYGHRDLECPLLRVVAIRTIVSNMTKEAAHLLIFLINAEVY